MTQIVAPATSYEATLEFGTSGLVGTLKLGTYDGDTAIQALAATAINEIGTSGIYVATRTSPTAAGQYVLVWSFDGTLNPDQVATEDLTVTYSTSTPALPSGRDLCTLADIMAYIPGYDTDPNTDAILQELITATSTDIYNDTRREFRPVATNPSAKTFDLSVFEAAERRVFVGDLANTTGLTVAITQLDGTAVASLTMTSVAIIGLPRNREEWEPFNHLWFPSELADAPTMSASYVMTVTGNWGFPSIPPDIRTACIKLVIVRYLRDVATGGTAFSDAVTDDGFELSAAFASARDTIESYTFLTIA